MVVTLIGYRGCGKSSVGPILAQLLGYDCADSDHVIEQRCQKNIAQIFSDDGEAGFREVESDVLAELLCRNRLVLSAGGGAILADMNRQRMQAAGPVVWLRVSAQELACRISGDAISETQRPSLTGKSIVDEVTEVLNFRTPIYSAAATITVNAEDSAPDVVAREIFHLVSESTAGDRA